MYFTLEPATPFERSILWRLTRTEEKAQQCATTACDTKSILHRVFTYSGVLGLE